MSINLNRETDDCNQLGNTTGTTKKTEVNFDKSVAVLAMDELFENRMRREWLTTKEAAQYRLEDCRLLVHSKGA